jgi:hypothetical protein
MSSVLQNWRSKQQPQQIMAAASKSDCEKSVHSTYMYSNHINKSELFEIVERILEGKWRLNPLLDNISKENSPQIGETNNIFHTSQIKSLMQTTYNSSRASSQKILSLITVRRLPTVKIYVTYSIDANKANFVLQGDDLKGYIHRLPSWIDNQSQKRCFPKTGTKHSKWYPAFLENRFTEIAIGLRMLEIFLMRTQVDDTYTSKEVGVLELDVKVDIPQDLKDYLVGYDKVQNPKKLGDGKFLFKVNGVPMSKEASAIEHLAELPRFKMMYSKYLTDDEANLKEWDDYITSDKLFAAAAWMRHARLLIKQPDKKKIIVIDPWMKSIEGSESFKKLSTHVESIGWSLEFSRREIRDQMQGEGSCCVARLARLLHLADTYATTDDFDKAMDSPLPDIHALIASASIRIR